MLLVSQFDALICIKDNFDNLSIEIRRDLIKKIIVFTSKYEQKQVREIVSTKWI